MDKLEVDPKLFITCRLCLEEMGQYQIVPRVQQQIKYCFDIDVDPFDGLPQLICKACESILSQFNSVKQKFQEKQSELKSNIRRSSINSITHQQDVVTSTEQTETEVAKKEDTNNLKPFKLTLKRRQNNISETRVDLEQETDTCASSYSIIKNSDCAKLPKPSRKWRKKYDKFFVCKFCPNAYKDKKNNNHLIKHESLISKYSHLLNNCSISIPRVDDKTNLTQQPNTVVIDQNNIIQKYNEYFNILYKRKTDIEKTSSSECSDDNFISNRQRKRLRLESASSNETVILENKKDETIKLQQNTSKPVTNVIECVDIDSSDSDDNGTQTKTHISTNEDLLKMNTIRQNITACYNKFINRNELSDSNKSNKQMQHKILSMGRKVINKKRFHCIGLLRYLEYKHLDVHWNDKKVDYVHVRTKLKENEKIDNGSGWQNLSDITCVKENISLNSLLEKIHTFENNFSICNVPPSNTSSATLTLQIQNDNHSNSQKLLNPSPVANPKQLPKKNSLQESQNVKVIAGQSTTVDSVNNDAGLHMPIITSTVSLADLNIQIQNSEAESKTEDNPRSSKEAVSSQAFMPRIKVKPVSQLMAENSSNKASISSDFIPANSWNRPESINNTQENPQLYPYEVPISAQPNAEVNAQDWVYMHTVEIPNHKTCSPFLYIKNLMQIHNLILLNTDAKITSNLRCLIKFKPMFQQENRACVTLSVAFYSDTKNFCIKIKDSTSDIDIRILQPHWQWEILQLFRGDIADRILENAKKVNKKMHDATSYFVSLMRCIVFRKQQ